jgi:hypothetical protein
MMIFLFILTSLKSVVQQKNIRLNVEIDVAVPHDIAEDEKRLRLVEDGILKVISKGMYEEGLAFKVVKAKFDSS